MEMKARFRISLHIFACHYFLMSVTDQLFNFHIYSISGRSTCNHMWFFYYKSQIMEFCPKHYGGHCMCVRACVHVWVSVHVCVGTPCWGPAGTAKHWRVWWWGPGQTASAPQSQRWCSSHPSRCQTLQSADCPRLKLSGPRAQRTAHQTAPWMRSPGPEGGTTPTQRSFTIPHSTDTFISNIFGKIYIFFNRRNVLRQLAEDNATHGVSEWVSNSVKAVLHITHQK